MNNEIISTVQKVVEPGKSLQEIVMALTIGAILISGTYNLFRFKVLTFYSALVVLGILLRGWTFIQLPQALGANTMEIFFNEFGWREPLYIAGLLVILLETALTKRNEIEKVESKNKEQYKKLDRSLTALADELAIRSSGGNAGISGRQLPAEPVAIDIGVGLRDSDLLSRN